MDSAAVNNKRDRAVTAPPPSSRERDSHDYARQSVADDAVRQKERAMENRAALRRQAMSEINRQVAEQAFRETIEQERIRERHNMQAGVEKMVRTVVRKESAEAEQAQHSESAQHARTDYVREKVNSAYSNNSESPRDRELRPSPSELQQKRALERYQDSNRNSIDRTVELVV